MEPTITYNMLSTSSQLSINNTVENFKIDFSSIIDRTENIFDDIEILTRIYPDLERITTSSLIQESGPASAEFCGFDTAVDKDTKNSADSLIESNEYVDLARQPILDKAELSVFDLMDETFREKLSRADLEHFKKIGIRRISSSSPIQYCWRSKSLQTYEQGGRLGALDCGKGRRANWHIPFFGFALSDDLGKSNKESLRVCCFLCPSLVTVQCVQSTMQRHLFLKHEHISKALTQHSSSLKTDTFWKVIEKQVILCMSKLMPLNFVDCPEFRSYTLNLNQSFLPYSGARLVRVIAKNCYVPSLLWLKNALKNQVSGVAKSLVLTFDRVIKNNSTFFGCSVSFIDIHWIRKRYFLSLIPLDYHDSTSSVVSNSSDTANRMGAIVEQMFLDLFDVHKSSFLAVVGPSCDEINSVAKILGVPRVDCAPLELNATVEYALGWSPDSPPLSQSSLRQPLQKLQALMHYLRNSNAALSALRELGHGAEMLRKQVTNSNSWMLACSSMKCILSISGPLLSYLHSPLALAHYPNIADITPSLLDLQIYAELSSALKPVEFQSEIIQEHHVDMDLQHSLLWFFMDWLVYSSETYTRHNVYNVNQQTEMKIESNSFLEPVRAFRDYLGSQLRSSYLSPSLKTNRPDVYYCLCKSTFLDPRTKDFLFFSSSGYACDPATRTRPIAVEILFTDAVHAVRIEMTQVLTALLQQSSLDTNIVISSPLKQAIHSLIRSIKFPLARRAADYEADGQRGGLDSKEGITGNTETAGTLAIEEEDLMSIMGGGINTQYTKKRRTNSSGDSEPSATSSSADRDLACDYAASVHLRIETVCREELDRYILRECPCAPCDIRNTDVLKWWECNGQDFPVLAILARSYCSIRSNSCWLGKLQDVMNKLHSKSRQFLSPGLLDATLFLHINGVLDSSIPEDIFDTVPDTYNNLQSQLMSQVEV